MGAFERRMAILHTLCRQREVTSDALASKYRVSSRTIRSDICALSRVYPIVSYVGRNGCYKLAEWKDSNDQLLTADEMHLLLRLMGELNGDDVIRLGSIINKIVDLPYMD